MSVEAAATPKPNLKARLLGGWLGDRLLRDTVVDSNEALGSRFRKLRLSAPWVRDSPPRAGDKVQVFIPALGTRTYTPFEVSAERGTFSLLVHLRAGERENWAVRLKPTDRVRLRPPEASTPLDRLAAPIALFGDETSLAIARSLFEAHPGKPLRVCLEVAAPAEALAACAALGLPADALVERRADGSHLPAIAQALATASGIGGSLVLTGAAPSIQRLRQLLRTTPRKQLVRAYWAEGKRGLE